MNYLGIHKDNLAPVVSELNTLLANYQVYYQNLRSFHWHIEGQNFFELHEIFEDLYNDAKVKIDEIAERVLTLRHYPMSNLADYLDHSDIRESRSLVADDEMIKVTLENHQKIIQAMRRVIDAADAAGDEGTIDMVGGFLADIEKRSWMLDAWRSKKFASAMM